MPDLDLDALQALTEKAAWRDSREPDWFNDIGYALQTELYRHHYDTTNRASKPDDPGWHACSCGWDGYWSDWQPHVTDHLRALIAPLLAELRQHREQQQWEYAVRWDDGSHSILLSETNARKMAPMYDGEPIRRRAVGPWEPVPPEEQP